jgi:hypothetical protein
VNVVILVATNDKILLLAVRLLKKNNIFNNNLFFGKIMATYKIKIDGKDIFKYFAFK